MANRAYLVANNDSGTAGRVGDDINYLPDLEILAGVSNLIPVLWLSLFSEDDLRHHEAEGARIPTLVTSTTDARKRLRARSSLLKKALPDNSKQLVEWKKLIAEIPFGFVKIDAAEIWELLPDFFEEELAAAVRWFSSQAKDDFQELLAISETNSGSEGEIFQFDDPPKANLYGCKWVRDVPWNDAEESAPPRRKKKLSEVVIKPEVLEKHPLLRKFVELDYFHNAGKPAPFDWAVGKGSGLLDAYFTYADRKWGTVKALQAWPPVLQWVQANLHVDAQQYYMQQKDELDTSCLEIYWKRISPRLPREARQYKVAFDMYFAFDLMHITIERELVAQGMPEGLCSRLLQVYEAGHLPCGWEGTYPEGKMLIH